MAGHQWRRRGREQAPAGADAGGRMGPQARTAALLVAVALILCLLLAALIAAEQPARAGAAGEPGAEAAAATVVEDSTTDAASEAEAPEEAEPEEGECPEGAGADGAAAEPAEGAEGECEPAPPEEESEEGEEPPEEERPAEEEQPPAEPAQPPAAATEEAEAEEDGAPAAEPSEPRTLVRGSSIDAPRATGRDRSRGRRGHGLRRGAGAPASGGTAVPGPGAGRERQGAAEQPPPSRWHWAGAWSIPWSIVACESGGDYGALNPSSGAGGAYQIIPSTWRAYGGKGASHTAPAAEQDRIAARIWADAGAAPWECAWGGRYLGAGLAGALGPLPDPLPPARRLDAAYVALAIGIARAQRIDWGLLLGTVRVRGGRGAAPASAAELRRIAARIATLGPAPNHVVARRLFERRSEALRATALAHYNRAVGRLGLVHGLTAVSERLQRRVLRSQRLRIYAGGREDVRAGRVDVRVLTLMLYLGRRFDPVTVSSLITGHSFFTAGGRPSNHAFGQAVDIAALDEQPILGSQQPGGLTERALRWIMLMPHELQSEELISLFSLGGPSFAAADHADHIHVGF